MGDDGGGFPEGVSLAKTAICVISENGQVVTQTQAGSEPKALVTTVGELDGSIAATSLEADPLSQSSHHDLTNAGMVVVLMKTRQVKGALKAIAIMTHHRDDEGIAHLLHLG